VSPLRIERRIELQGVSGQKKRKRSSSLWRGGDWIGTPEAGVEKTWHQNQRERAEVGQQRGEKK
jgi:hypothetical protein